MYTLVLLYTGRGLQACIIQMYEYVYLFSYTTVHSIEGPSATQGRGLQNEVVLRV